MQKTTLDSASYTDLNRLASLKSGDRDGEANVRKVAQEFEALFLNQMLKSMRAASDVMADKDSPSNSQASLQYRDLHDQQLSVTLSRQGGGIGLADVLVRQMSLRSQKPAVSRGRFQSGSAAVEQGRSQGFEQAAGQPSVRNDAELLARRRLAIPGRATILKAQALAQAAKQRMQSSDSSTQYAENSALPGDWKQRLARYSEASKVAQRAYTAQQGSAFNGVFESPEHFVATLLPMAEKAARKLGVDPEMLVAQAALETGWGKSMIRTTSGQNSHNLFGIKSALWDGPSAKVLTTEYVNGQPVKEVAGFRVYTSFEQSFADYAAFLQGNARYKNALQAGDSKRFMQELQRAGYATDPQYAQKVLQIAQKVQDTYQDIAEAGATPAVRTRG